MAALQVDLNDIRVELFASKEQHLSQLYGSRNLNNAYCCNWRVLGLCHANLPTSQLTKILTKIALEGAKAVLYCKKTCLLETVVGPYDCKED